MNRFFSFPWCCNLLILGFIWGCEVDRKEKLKSSTFPEATEDSGCFAVSFHYGRNNVPFHPPYTFPPGGPFFIYEEPFTYIS